MDKVRKRLWKAGGLIAILIASLWIGNLFVPKSMAFDSHMYGHDFLPFYTAGQMIRTGQGGHLYDPVLTRELEHNTCRDAGLVINNEYGAFLNPPFAALPAVGFARWPYRTALGVWTVLLLSFLFVSIVLLVKMLPPETDWRTWGLVPLLLFTAMPAWQAAMHAQNTFFSLLVLSTAVFLWRKEKSFLAGMVAGLLLFKPQLGLIVIVVISLSQGRRAFAGAAITASALLLINLIALPGSIGSYLHQLPVNLRAIQILPNYTWQRHVTFLAWWRMLLQGHIGALPSALTSLLATTCMTIFAAFVARMLWRARNDHTRTDRLIAATITATPLLMPYYMDYDLTLLSVAAVLCAADAIRNGIDRSVLAGWVAFYALSEFNPQISGATRVIPDVLGLLLLSSVLIQKASRSIAATEFESIVLPQHRLAA
jgi:hypothetical protein